MRDCSLGIATSYYDEKRLSVREALDRISGIDVALLYHGRGCISSPRLVDGKYASDFVNREIESFSHKGTSALQRTAETHANADKELFRETVFNIDNGADYIIQTIVRQIK